PRRSRWVASCLPSQYAIVVQRVWPRRGLWAPCSLWTLGQRMIAPAMMACVALLVSIIIISLLTCQYVSSAIRAAPWRPGWSLWWPEGGSYPLISGRAALMKWTHPYVDWLE